MAFPLSLLALMVVASATAGPIEVIEISPDVGLHFDQEDIDVQRHLTKRSPVPPFDPFSKKTQLFTAKTAPFTAKTTKFSGLLSLGVFGDAAGGAGGLAGVGAPLLLEALPLGISAAPAFG